MMKTFVPPHVILEKVKVMKDFLHPLKWHLGWHILIQVINTGGLDATY
jgi:hypothetical protein